MSTAGGEPSEGSDSTWLWFPIGALFGVLMRALFGAIPSEAFEVMSLAFLVGVPFTVGALTVFGRRRSIATVAAMIVQPWLAVIFMLIGCALVLLEGSICLAILTPLFLVCGSLGGVCMGGLLRVVKTKQTRMGAVAVLPFMMVAGESQIPQVQRNIVITHSVPIDAAPERVWEEIVTAKGIERDELPFSIVHSIGVPRPVEGVNEITEDGEIRYSVWERGVHFRAVVTRRVDHRTISWRYEFDDDSFPEGSMDEHVRIGGRYFDLHDTTFNLVPLPGSRTELEIIARYSVRSSVNLYAVPASIVLGHDFVRTILGLYKRRSEAPAGG